MAPKKDNSMTLTNLADWITIITGPLTFISATIAFFNIPLEINLAQDISDYERIAIFLILTVMNFSFLFEVSLRLPNILIRTGVTSFGHGLANFIFHILFLFFFIALQLLFVGKLFPNPAKDIVSFAIVGPSLFWVITGILVAIDASDKSKKKT